MERSRRDKASASFSRKTAQALLAIAAIEIGIWAGLEVSPQPAHDASVGEASSPGVKKFGPELRSDDAVIGRFESDGNSFALLSKWAHEQPETVSGGGSADVFDQNGRLVRRYLATERADHSWELMERYPSNAR